MLIISGGKKKQIERVWFLAQTHWYIGRSPITWWNEVFIYFWTIICDQGRKQKRSDLFVVLGGALGRHTTRAGRGHEEASGSTFARKFQSQVGPECQGQRTVFLCVFVFTCILCVFFVCVFLFYILCSNRTWESQGQQAVYYASHWAAPVREAHIWL